MKNNHMIMPIKPILVTSIAVLVTHSTMAQPISASTSKAFTLEQGLSCLDWAKKEHAFTIQLAIGDSEQIQQYGLARLQKQFQQQYSKQKTKQIDDPEDENFCMDCPETTVYLPKNKSNPIQRVETMRQVSAAGAHTSIYRNDDIANTQQNIENGLNIKMSHYTAQQFQNFKKEWRQASAQDNEQRSKTKQVFQRYPHLKVFNGEVSQNQKLYLPQQIYIYSQPYKRDASDPNGMIAYISLYENPVNPTQHILQCGFIDNMF